MSRAPRRRRHGRHRRANTATDATRNGADYHVTGTWPGQDKPARYRTPDPARAKRIAKTLAERGATAVLERHLGHGQWRVIHTYQPTHQDPT